MIETTLENNSDEAVMHYAEQIFAEPLDVRTMDPIAFHIVHLPDGRDCLIIQYEHMIMDANSTRSTDGHVGKTVERTCGAKANRFNRSSRPMNRPNSCVLIPFGNGSVARSRRSAKTPAGVTKRAVRLTDPAIEIRAEENGIVVLTLNERADQSLQKSRPPGARLSQPVDGAFWRALIAAFANLPPRGRRIKTCCRPVWPIWSLVRSTQTRFCTSLNSQMILGTRAR